ncbi:MAG: divalent-cation tolerance protein CutA [Coriobacteriales bacterium]|nr:divalent-cation tolerance protein CutA [Coriobacteriales bacterium]
MVDEEAGRVVGDLDEFCATEPCVVVIATTGTEEEAKAITDELLDERLAACVQKIPIFSSYHWQGKRCDEAELMLLIKTRASLYQGVEASIKANHSYEVPEIIQVPITGALPEYLQWIIQQTEEPRFSISF